MTSGAAARREPDRWVGSLDDLALFSIVLGFVLLVAVPVFDYLLVGPGADGGNDGPTVALALLVVLAVGAALVVSNAGDRLETLLDPPDPDETIWYEVRRFGVAVAGAGILLGIPTGLLLDRTAIPNTVTVAVVQTLLFGFPLGALALRRRGRAVGSVGGKVHAAEVDVVAPSEAEGSAATGEESSEADDWDRWDDVALFASLFAMARLGFWPQYALLLGVGGGLGVLYGSVAVALRHAGALVPDGGDDVAEPTTADGDRDGDGATTGTD